MVRERESCLIVGRCCCWRGCWFHFWTWVVSECVPYFLLISCSCWCSHWYSYWYNFCVVCRCSGRRVVHSCHTSGFKHGHRTNRAVGGRSTNDQSPHSTFCRPCQQHFCPHRVHVVDLHVSVVVDGSVQWLRPRRVGRRRPTVRQQFCVFFSVWDRRLGDCLPLCFGFGYPNRRHGKCELFLMHVGCCCFGCCCFGCCCFGCDVGL